MAEYRCLGCDREFMREVGEAPITCPECGGTVREVGPFQ